MTRWHLRRRARRRRGPPAAPAHRAPAQGALPGRQRAAARPGAGPGGRRSASPVRPTVAVNACYLGEQVVGARRRPGARSRSSPDDPLGTAGGRGQPARLDRRPGRAGRQRRRLPGRSRRDAGPGHRRPARRLGRRTVRLLGQPVAGRAPPAASAATGSPASRCCPGARARPAGRPGDLVRAAWRPAEAAGELEVVGYAGTYLDTGTPADYLAANLHAAAGGSLIDPTAEVTGDGAASGDRRGRRVGGTVTRVRGLAGRATVARADETAEPTRSGPAEAASRSRPVRPRRQRADSMVATRSPRSSTRRPPVITAIVLIDCATDSIPEVAETLAALDGVSEVYSVAGNVDLIAIVRVAQFDADRRGHRRRISKTPGRAQHRVAHRLPRLLQARPRRGVRDRPPRRGLIGHALFPYGIDQVP